MRPLTTAEVTACIYHYMDMCPVVAQRMPVIGFIHFAMEELPSSNRILSPTLGYKQANKLVNRVSITSSTEIFWCCPCPLPKVSVTMHPRDAETHSGKHQSGSNESVSTFPKACRFAYLPQQQRPQRSTQKAWRHLVPASPALPSVTGTAPQACVSRTSSTSRHGPFPGSGEPILILPPTSCHQVEEEILAAYTSNCVSVPL